jgi:D-alanyl-D-alanine carboxypeptidase
MTVNHKDLTGAALHESKGVSSASANNVYVANGSGSGTWEKIDKDAINTSSIKNLNKIYITYTIPDISTAGSHFVVTPIAGDIDKIYSTINNAITSVNCGLTFEIGGTLVTNGAITIAYSGSAAGTIDNSTPSGANTLTAGQAIEIITNGASSTSCRGTITFEIDVS